MDRRILVLAVCILTNGVGLSGLQTRPVAAATPPTLTDQSLRILRAPTPGELPGTVLTVTCSTTEPNTMTFAASGLAVGPYPGTFTEQGA